MGHVESYLSCSGGHVLAATGTILVTTLDDCIWLLPFLVHTHHDRAWLHALVFVATLTGLTATVSVTTVLLQEFVSSRHVWNDTNQHAVALVWSIVGARLCWILALYFGVRSWCKQTRRARASAPSRALENNLDQVESTLLRVDLDATGTSPYGSTSTRPVHPFSDRRGDSDTLGPVWTVMSLTLLGALDEVAYFPALIVARAFSVTELVLGSALAAGVILLVVTCCWVPCRPLLTWLDQIPLYVVISVYAILLTMNAVRDALEYQP